MGRDNRPAPRITWREAKIQLAPEECAARIGSRRTPTSPSHTGGAAGPMLSIMPKKCGQTCLAGIAEAIQEPEEPEGDLEKSAGQDETGRR